MAPSGHFGGDKEGTCFCSKRRANQTSSAVGNRESPSRVRCRPGRCWRRSTRDAECPSNASVEDEIREFGQGGNKQLLGQGDVEADPGFVHHELAVGTQGLDGPVDPPGRQGVEGDGVLGIEDDLVEQGDPVGNLGVAEESLVQKLGDGAGVVPVQLLEYANRYTIWWSPQ